MLRALQIISVCLFLNGNLFSQAPACEKIPVLIQALQQQHLQSPKLDDAWATRVYEEMFFLLDPTQTIFTQTDLNELAKSKLANDPATGSCILLPEISKRYTIRLAEAEKYLTTILKGKLTFNNKESARIDPDYSDWAKDRAELEYQWLTTIKHECLIWMQRNAPASLATLNPKELSRLEEQARAAILKSEQLRFDRMKATASNENNHLNLTFFKAIAHSFDPHTEYFTSELKEKFFNSLDKEGLSFGVEWTEDQLGRIKIARLNPGGAAWKSNELNQGDELLSISWNNGAAKDILLYDLESLYHDFESTEYKLVSITVKKSDGQVRTVSLAKSKIELTDNAIRSYVLSGSSKVGYIMLPGFYGSDGESTKGCADDVAREILKLKKENIAGLILDLRFNGGGSLLEAINLAGVFIDNGPLALMQEVNQPAITLKDLNRGTLYSGPLVILVNGFSASASELVSAALQDWNRAILVGSKTYGKATGQVILPINNPALNGFIKVTNERLYRVTGKSLQQKGITPDIVLPDAYEGFFQRELNLRNSIAPDSIIKKVYYSALPALPLSELKQRSLQRQTIAFKEIAAVADLLAKPIPLEPVAYAAYYARFETDYKPERSKIYNVSITGFDTNLHTADDYRKIVSEEVLEEISKSRYIEEAFQIIQDYMALTKTK
jgi:carboxyl-terminal processing protease